MIYPSSFENKIGFDFVRNEILSRCDSAIARNLVAGMAFSTDFSDIEKMLDATSEMVLAINSRLGLHVDGQHDVMPLLTRLRIPGSLLPATDLHHLLRQLEMCSAVKAFFSDIAGSDEVLSEKLRVLSSIAADIEALPQCEHSISSVIDKFGNIRDNASPELARIRQAIVSASGSVNAAMRRVMAQALSEGYIEADTTPSMRDGRLVIPVLPMHKRKINGIVHDESASGKTVYIEPAEVVSANNRIRELQIEQRREESRILLLLADELRQYVDIIIADMQILGELDFIRAKALFAIDFGGHKPALHQSPELEWYHACHPGLQHSLSRQGREIVALDITLTKQQRILVISGPNAGGKSVCLKTVGVIQYMMQCGVLPTVYENSHFGVFDDVFVDIGDDQSLEDDLSTYSSHLRNMKLILQRGGSRSLMLIDEFGGGTEPQIGGALAQAILHHFNELKIWGVVTTHYQNLKHFAEDTDGLVNGSMLYDRHLMRPLFKLSIGNPGSSFALEIARKTGLPIEIIDEAKAIVGSDYVNLDKYLLDIARDKKYWENKRHDIRIKEKKMDGLLQRYEEEAEELRSRRREIISSAKDEAQRIIDSSNAAVERTIATIKNAQAEREKTIAERRKLKEQREKIGEEQIADHPLLRKAPKSKKTKKSVDRRADKEHIAIGDIVKLDGEGTPGKVLEINGKKAIVAFGMLKTTVELSRLKPTLAKLPAAAARPLLAGAEANGNSRSRQLNFKPEIDVRGMRVDEAVQAVTYFIDDAIQFSIGRVRILHGTGTGALRQYIREYLSTVAGVAGYHDEDVRFGGAGITVVEL